MCTNFYLPPNNTKKKILVFQNTRFCEKGQICKKADIRMNVRMKS